jgi:hypothetical protein
MAGHKIYDVGSVLVPFMEQKLIDRQYSGGLFGFDQLFAVDSIQFLQAGQIDTFDRIFAESGDFSDLLKCIGPLCQIPAGVLMQFSRYLMVWRFERDGLHMRMSALAAEQLLPVKTDH